MLLMIHCGQRLSYYLRSKVINDYVSTDFISTCYWNSVGYYFINIFYATLGLRSKVI